MRLSLLFLFSVSLLFTACSVSNDPYVEKGIVGGVSGTVIGAGTGALVGSAISSGDVAASALLGGAVGLPVGVIAGVAYQSMTEKTELEKNAEIIEKNARHIASTQEEIESLRAKLLDVPSNVRPAKYLKAPNPYTGPTIGVYNR